MGKHVYLQNQMTMKIHKDSYLYHPIAGNFLSFFAGFFILSLSTYINGSFGWIEGDGPILIGVFVAVTWAIRLHAYREAERFEIKRIVVGRTGHSIRYTLRVLIFFFIGLVIHATGEGIVIKALWMAIFCALYIAGIFWLLFDGILNIDRGKALTYVSKHYKGSRIDNLFAKINSPVLWFATKILVFLFTLWLYHQSFKWFN